MTGFELLPGSFPSATGEALKNLRKQIGEKAGQEKKEDKKEYKVVEQDDDKEVKKLADQFDVVEHETSKKYGEITDERKALAESLRCKVIYKKAAEREPSPTVEIRNRAALVTKKDFGKSEITFQWSHEESSDSQYPEDLKIALRSPGKPNEKRWHEYPGDVIVVFHGGTQQVKIEGPGFDTVLGTAEFPPAKKGKLSYQKVRIVDDDRGVRVYVGETEKSVVELPPNLTPVRPDKKGESKIAIYNREPVAGVIHSSTFSTLEIKEVK